MAAVRAVKVRLTPAAQQDLAAILAYLERQSPQGRRRVGSAIRRTLVLLTASPFIGRPGEIKPARLFPVHGYPYLIAYSVDAERNVISVASIVHMARDPGYIGPS
ncbi:type II toxin-antitoxin system RelE/ParE family toxin [Xanthobacter aminoxidans]|uniref:type II toxin-antitoxin system RelE/ParE family toxin n=1 Tax=Xanthobacter aminoxidans TaxID=186280 RepID=UPI0037275CB4